MQFSKIGKRPQKNLWEGRERERERKRKVTMLQKFWRRLFCLTLFEHVLSNHGEIRNLGHGRNLSYDFDKLCGYLWQGNSTKTPLRGQFVEWSLPNPRFESSHYTNICIEHTLLRKEAGNTPFLKTSLRAYLIKLQAFATLRVPFLFLKSCIWL